MRDALSRRHFLATTSAAAGLAAMEAGWPGPARAEDGFTVTMTGGNWGNGQIKAFVTNPDFEKKANVKVTYEFAQDNIRAAKAVASCGNPIFTTLEAQSLQAVLLAEGGCISPYDLDVVTNYKDIFDAAKEPARAGLKDFYAPCLLMAYGLTYNAKEVKEPGSFEDLMSPRFKGRIAVPSFDWMGPQFLYSMNAVLGGSPDNLDRGFQFISDLIRKNDAVMFNNSDTAAQAFIREEIVAAPFWNGRTNTMSKSGVPVKIAYPKGWVATGSGHVITKGSKFNRQANMLVNNFLDPVNQLSLSTAFGYPPSNRKSILPTGYEFMQIPDSAFERAAKLDYGTLSTAMATNLERWNKDVLG